MKTIELKNRVEWRAWLIENHDREKEIWLIYYKKVTGIPSIEYGESLDEALCFGWVDSLIKKMMNSDTLVSSPPGLKKTSTAWQPAIKNNTWPGSLLLNELKQKSGGLKNRSNC